MSENKGYSRPPYIIIGHGEIKMKNTRITIRVEPEEREKLDRLKSEGKIRNLTEPIYRALKEFLKDA